MSGYHFAPYRVTDSSSTSKHNPSFHNAGDPGNLAPILFDSAELSQQGLSSYKDLIKLYNTVTDGEYLSTDDGTADRLVDTGTWTKLSCWKTLYQEFYIPDRDLKFSNAPPTWSFEPKLQTVLVGWDHHKSCTAHDCTEMRCTEVLSDVRWVRNDFGMHYPVLDNTRVYCNPRTAQVYTPTGTFIRINWGGEYREALEKDMIGPLSEYNRQMFSWLARSLYGLWMIPLPDLGGVIRKGWLLDLDFELDKYVHTMAY